MLYRIFEINPCSIGIVVSIREQKGNPWSPSEAVFVPRVENIKRATIIILNCQRIDLLS